MTFGPETPCDGRLETSIKLTVGQKPSMTVAAGVSKIVTVDDAVTAS